VEVVYWKIMFLRPVETILRSGGGGQRRMMEEVTFTKISTVVNVTRYPQYTNNMLITMNTI
jgi:hypothetical protein